MNLFQGVHNPAAVVIVADGPGRPQKEDQPRDVRKQFYTTREKADALSAASEPGSDIVNRLLDGWLQREQGEDELADVEEKIAELEAQAKPIQDELEELYAKRDSLRHEKTLQEFQEDQEEAWRDIVRDSPPRSPGQWQEFAKNRAEAQAIGLDRALEIVEEETGVEVRS